MKAPDENFKDLLDRTTEINALCRFEEADALLNEAIASYPDRPELAAHHMRLAQGRGDHYEALRRAQAMIQNFPKHQAGYLGGIRSFQAIGRHDSANILADAALQAFANQSWPLHLKAQIAASLAAYADAEKFWNDARTRFPKESRGWLGTAALFTQIGRLEAAEAMLAEAISNFPHDERVRVSFAESAENLKRWSDADRRWNRTRQTFRDNAVARLRYALVPAQDNKPDESFKRLRLLLRAYPDDIDAHVEYIELLSRQNRLDEARAYAAKSMRSFPDAAKLAIAFSRTEQARKNTGAAIDILQRFIAGRPHVASVYTELVATLGRADRIAEAEAVCKVALMQSRFHPGHHLIYATLAMWQERWATALERWNEAAKWAPGWPGVRVGIATAEMMLGEQSGTASTTASNGSGNVLSDLMMNFESLGGSAHGFGCEFRIVQRRFGAEPVGLLRWSDMPAHLMIEALETRFEGVGTVEQTHVLPPSDQGEHFAKDSRFQIVTHTFFDSGFSRMDKVMEQTCRRLQFLRRKFIEDLESSRKIFTYKPRPTPSMDLIEGVFRAMRKYGENTLLFVRPANEAHAGGTVDVVEPGLLIGYLDESPAVTLLDARKPNYASWLQICWNAYRLGKPQVSSERLGHHDSSQESESSAA